MPELVPNATFTTHESGDGTWYVEVFTPGLAREEVGDFRSKACAEAWILESLRGGAVAGGPGTGSLRPSEYLESEGTDRMGMRPDARDEGS